MQPTMRQKMCSNGGVGSGAYSGGSDNIDFKVAKGPQGVLKQHFSHK